MFCSFYIIIIEKANSHFYNYKPEIVYETSTESTDDKIYNSIFFSKERLAYYNEINIYQKLSVENCRIKNIIRKNFQHR
ncbi:Hypothetical protein SRAE_1000339900 [Strongyloides ratti]|uniref:Uncharacterized protein n=1 Tax=Strongyloides ratti TaxID=34506 RepID=A0A090L5T7_STRRB|nr:Hypothetical protein SRAE_1000339900 [Strongyloides ratti]CEF65146.1 Hypothetical protein SRAE_1000339900 [Strongyloides ratti]